MNYHGRHGDMKPDGQDLDVVSHVFVLCEDAKSIAGGRELDSNIRIGWYRNPRRREVGVQARNESCRLLRELVALRPLAAVSSVGLAEWDDAVPEAGVAAPLIKLSVVAVEACSQ